MLFLNINVFLHKGVFLFVFTWGKSMLHKVLFSETHSKLLSFKKKCVCRTEHNNIFLKLFLEKFKLSPLKAVSSVSHLQNTNCKRTTDFTKTQMNSHMTQGTLIQRLQL